MFAREALIKRLTSALKRFYLDQYHATHSTAMSLEELGDDAFDRLRARRLLAITGMTPMNAIAAMLNTALTLAVLWNLVEPWQAVLWAGSVVLLMAMAVQSWYGISRKPAPPQKAPARVENRAVIHAGLLALLWASPPLLLYDIASTEQQIFITAITSGLICAGGFALYTLPSASLTFVAILGSASAITLYRAGFEISPLLLLLLVVYMTILTTSIVHAAGVFRAQVLTDLTSEHQKQVISLLLNDFEQSTADVLWEADEELKLQRVSPKLEELFAIRKELLDDHSFLKLIRQSHAQLPSEQTELADSKAEEISTYFTMGRAFRDFEIPVWINRKLCWWSITATPTPDMQWRGVISDVTETHQARQQIWQLAHEDSVTRLANRRWFQTELQSSIQRSLNHKEQIFALLSIDLDRFKNVNDTFGHDIGDKLLKIIAGRLKGNTRPADLVARTGGDEFAVILRQVDSQQQAIDIANRIVETLEQPCRIGSLTVTVGASIGLAFIPDDGQRQELLLKHADLALYRAKENGRGQVVRFAPQMAVTANQLYRIEQSLRRAVSNGELKLHYQPQRHLASGHFTCSEVLARWSDPVLGSISPATFIKVAEDTGIIHALGKQILQQACLHARLMPAGMTLAVNLSPVQLASPSIVDDIVGIIQSHHVPFTKIELEITESALLDDSYSVQDKLQQLRELGVRIALDDFGTGYSSLSYLRRFSFDKIKIDQSFVRDLPNDPATQVIVKGMIDIARSMKMQVVAEGIEDEATLRTLTELGCDIGQGFHIFKPIAPEQLLETLVRAT